MMLTADQCYQAVLTRDARFDGRFFVAVRTTRVYCRPICRVKTPMQKNCTFFNHAAAAEAAGYRPCKRCRPELAPGSSLMEVSSQLARRTAYHIGQDFLNGRSLEELAGRLGVTDRQMRRVFRAEFGVSPVEFWQTQRLLLAKQLLTDSRMPVTAVALASGFGSLRRFNTLVKKRYRMTPTEFRRQQRRDVADSFSDFSFRLAYRPPLDWERLAGFLGARGIPGAESVHEGAYCRTLSLQRGTRRFAGYVEVRHDAAMQALRVRLSDGLLPACAAVLERIKRLFDLHADPAAIAAALQPLAGVSPGLRVPGCVDGFEMAVRAILGQQVSVAGARTLAGRMTARFGDAIATPIPGLTHLFPTAARIAGASEGQIAPIGMPAKRARTLLAVARAVAAGKLLLEPGGPIEESLAQLRAIAGIGEWTAQYIAMRSLAWPDAFPHGDLGLQKALGTRDTREILRRAETWRPWRAYAALHLWTTLEKKNMTSYAILKTPSVGELLLVASATHLVGIYFVSSKCAPPVEDDWTHNPDHPVLREASMQLGEYLAGSRRDFSVPLFSQGTPFQKEIWRQIARIPFGQTITYSELARRAGAPRAIRAAGTATGKNPLGIIVPCHRVIAKGGALGGFAGGLQSKRTLLKIERMTYGPSFS